MDRKDGTAFFSQAFSEFFEFSLDSLRLLPHLPDGLWAIELPEELIS